MATTISSTHNERVRALQRLQKRAERDRLRLTLVEGAREAQRALSAGVIPVEAWVCMPLLAPESAAALEQLRQFDGQRRTHLFEVSPELFARLVIREESGGILLVVPYLNRSLLELPLGNPAFVAVVEGVEKPGNLGAILRTADAAGVDAIIVNRGATDIHNPNVIRASLGGLFTVPICEASTEETIRLLRERGITTIVATPDAGLSYTAVNMTDPVAIVLGAEAEGLSDEWLQAADQTVRIPMVGVVDSLNLASSAALLLYEVVRQRGG
jgi:TrmH family RNA methyltransferase